MNVALRILARLLLYRPLVIVALVLVYLTTVLLLLTVQNGVRGIVVATMGAFAAGATAALLTDRIARYSFAAGSLGLPDHSRLVRLAQRWFLVLFVGIPAGAAITLGTPPLVALAVLAAAAAAGILLARGVWWLFLAPVLAQWKSLTDWLALPAIQALAVAASAWMIWKWFQLPQLAERAGGLAPTLLADARHEAVDRMRDQRTQETSEQDANGARADGTVVSPASYDVRSGRNLAVVLALVFGYSIATSWRAVANGLGTAAIVLIAWHVLHGHNPEELGYVVVTVVCCVALVVRLQGILQRWVRTSTEQALLRLAPQWPEPRSIKLAVVRSAVLVQRGPAVIWFLSSLLVASLGWVSERSVAAAAIAMLATSLAFSGALFAVLARRRVREWHLSTVAEVILVGAGGLVTVVGSSPSDSRQIYGAILMWVPPALALCWYLIAPLRLPIDVDPRALQAQL